MQITGAAEALNEWLSLRNNTKLSVSVILDRSTGEVWARTLVAGNWAESQDPDETDITLELCDLQRERWEKGDFSDLTVADVVAIAEQECAKWERARTA